MNDEQIKLLSAIVTVQQAVQVKMKSMLTIEEQQDPHLLALEVQQKCIMQKLREEFPHGTLWNDT